MAVTPRLTAEDLKALDDQKWRRLGITQTFDRLLVASAACHPGPPLEVVQHASEGLSGGAAKFWDLSVAKIQQDLIRRRVLVLSSSVLSLHDEFHERAIKLLKEIEDGVSHVAPTPGANLEEIMERGRQRELQKSKTSSSRSGTSRKPKKRESALAKPVKRTADRSGITDAQSPANKAPAMAGHSEGTTATAAPKLFTSLRMNRLLDHLDHAKLSTKQLGERLDMKTNEMSLFLKATDALDITRVSKDSLVDLHWRGRDLARTSDAERRMELHSVVRELRAHTEAGSAD